MIAYLKGLISNRRNIITLVVLSITARAVIVSIGISEALIVLGCLGLEGYLYFLSSKDKAQLSNTDVKDTELLNRIASLESKFNLTNLRK
jgi:hypothetical protein